MLKNFIISNRLILSNILSNFYLIISIFFLIFVFYRSEIIYDGLRDDFYFTFKILAFFLVFFAIFSFFISYKINFTLFVLIFFAVSTIYICEIYLILINKKIQNKIYISKEIKNAYFLENNIQFDERSKLEIYQENKKLNKDIVAKYSPGALLGSDNLEVFPLSGIANKLTIYCNENGYYSQYYSDKYGFNNENEVWDSDQIDIMILGDSYAHGACVNRPNDLASQLKAISKKNVVTVGYEGNGPLLSYAAFKEFSSKKKVDKVVYIFNESNDFNEIKREKNNKILKNYLYDNNFSQSITNKQILVDKIIYENLLNYYEQFLKNTNNKKKIEYRESISVLIKRFIFFYRVRIQLKEKFDFQDEDFEALEIIFKNYKKMAKERNFDFYIIFMPSFERLVNKLEVNRLSIAKEIADKNNIKYLDINEEILSKMENSMKLLPFEMKGKIDDLNTEGYKILANRILDLIY